MMRSGSSASWVVLDGKVDDGVVFKLVAVGRLLKVL
jgi:hypothetical protein